MDVREQRSETSSEDAFMLCEWRQAVGKCGFVVSTLLAMLIGVTANGDQQVQELARQIATDIEQWSAETAGDPVSDNARGNATDMLIRLLVDASELEVADSLSQQLHREFEYWDAVHPVLLEEGRFEDAAEIAKEIVKHNVRMRGFVIADTFAALAMQESLDSGFSYLNDVEGLHDYQTRSAVASAFIKVASHYHDLGDESTAERAISRIESSQAREVAQAVLVAKSPTLEAAQIRPFFLQLLEDRSTARRNSRCRQPWFVQRVQAYAKAASGQPTSFAEYSQDVAVAHSVKSLAPSDRMIGTGLDIITASLCDQEDMPPATATSEPNIAGATLVSVSKKVSDTAITPETMAEELSDRFEGEIKDGLSRTWIAYALSRSGHWTTDDVKKAWKSRQKYENPEWIIGFAAGFDQSGRGRTIQRLVELTKTHNARTYLRLGQLIARVSPTSHPNIPRQAMK